MAKMTERSRDLKSLEAENKTGKPNLVKKDLQVNKGAWTAEEDQKLAQVIAIHGPKRWKTIAAIAGLNRCGKSCRLRWLNYLRPNIKRGNISDQEEDLILRLHKLLGNRWSLIAGRLPGRTDNEIKNYWNSHLSKKINHHDKDNKQSLPIIFSSTTRSDKQGGSINDEKRASTVQKVHSTCTEATKGETNNNCISNNYYAPEGNYSSHEGSIINGSDFDVDDFFDFSDEGPLNLEWMSEFLELERT